MPLWEKLRMPKALRADSVASMRVNDLRLAASFIKSIDTADAKLDLEIRRAAQQIEDVAELLAGRARNADHTYQS